MSDSLGELCPFPYQGHLENCQLCQRVEVRGGPVDQHAGRKGCREPRKDGHETSEDVLHHLTLCRIRLAVGAHLEAHFSHGESRQSRDGGQDPGGIGNSQIGGPERTSVGETLGTGLCDPLERQKVAEHEWELEEDRNE